MQLMSLNFSGFDDLIGWLHPNTAAAGYSVVGFDGKSLMDHSERVLMSILFYLFQIEQNL